MNNFTELKALGWQPFFQQQLTLTEYESKLPARIISHDRSRYLLLVGTRRVSLNITHALPEMTVGDWLLLDPDDTFYRLLDRKSLFSRRGAGSKIDRQLIASNVETAFIMSSLNHDFNLSRIERYLVLANEAGVDPIVVLTKADLCDNAEKSVSLIKEFDPYLRVEFVNTLDPSSCACLKSVCAEGQTVALLGSSGVGKSTLVNTLLNSNTQVTRQVRTDDSKGRHTTTARTMHFVHEGGIIIDTPGMRELQLADHGDGVDSTFEDIHSLASCCKFANCKHDQEVGCAVLSAIDKGTLEPRRLVNYHKLKRESLRNSMALHEVKAKEKTFSKMVNSVTRKPIR